MFRRRVSEAPARRGRKVAAVLRMGAMVVGMELAALIVAYVYF
jgi:hypothetical protein